MRNILLLIFVAANIFFCNAEEFIVRLHMKDVITKEYVSGEYTLTKSLKGGKWLHADSIVKEIAPGVLEITFDKRPTAKTYGLIFGAYAKNDKKYRIKLLPIQVPKQSKSPYDIDVNIWGVDDYMDFDAQNSFTVIMQAKDSITNEIIPVNCQIWIEKPVVEDWAAKVLTTVEDGEIKITFKNRPKSNEKYELVVFRDKEKGTKRKYNSKYVKIKIPKKAKSPYRMPDVLMWGPEFTE